MKTITMIALGLISSLQLGRAGDPPTPPPPAPQPASHGTPATPPSDPAKFQIFLLVGQSNMAGRGPVTAADKVADPNVLVLDAQDQWVTEGEPIHYDKPGMTGVGPGYTFGKLLAAREPGVTIGLIPCAFGGTSLAQWDPKTGDKKLYKPYSLYENAIRRAQIAMKSGTLKGILWHQGEGDAKTSPETYAARLAPLVASFRADLKAPNVPFIAGEIGHFTYAGHPGASTINEQIALIPGVVPNSAFVSSEGLTDKGDHLHFSTQAQKEFAQRYLDAYLKLTAVK